MTKEDLVVEVKDVVKKGIYNLVEDENFRNKLIVHSAKNFLIGYGIGALVSDIIRRK